MKKILAIVILFLLIVIAIIICFLNRKNEYVHFMVDDKEHASFRIDNNFVELPVDPIIEGSKFSGWFIDKDFITPFNNYNVGETRVVFAKFINIEFSIMLDPGPAYLENNYFGTFSEGLVINIDDLPQLVYDYPFLGWSFINGDIITENFYMPNHNITLIANFDLPPFSTLTLDLDGGNFLGSNLEIINNVAEGTLISSLIVETPQKNENIFIGWLDEEGNLIDFSTATMPNRDLTLTASWDGYLTVINIVTHLDIDFSYSFEMSQSFDLVSFLEYFLNAFNNNNYFLGTLITFIEEIEISGFSLESNQENILDMDYMQIELDGIRELNIYILAVETFMLVLDLSGGILEGHELSFRVAVDAILSARITLDPQKNENIFMGWLDEEGNLIDFSTATMPKRDLTLTASWDGYLTVINIVTDLEVDFNYSFEMFESFDLISFLEEFLDSYNNDRYFQNILLTWIDGLEILGFSIDGSLTNILEQESMLIIFSGIQTIVLYVIALDSFTIGLNYDVEFDGTVSVVGSLFVTIQNLVIPRLHRGLDVVYVSGFASMGIETLVLPPSIIVIGDGAFDGNNISTLNLDNLPMLLMIGMFSFRDNNLMGNMDLSNLHNLQIINVYAFAHNEIEGIMLNNLTNLQRIGFGAFTQNSIESLELINLPQLIMIETYAFDGNSISDLVMQNLPLLTSIGSSSFYGNKIQVLELSGMPQLEEIGSLAFSNNGIERLVLSDLASLTTIGIRAFSDNYIEEIDLINLPNLDLQTSSDLFDRVFGVRIVRLIGNTPRWTHNQWIYLFPNSHEITFLDENNNLIW